MEDALRKNLLHYKLKPESELKYLLWEKKWKYHKKNFCTFAKWYAIYVTPIFPKLKPGLHEPQLPVEWNVTNLNCQIVSSIVVKRRCCALKVSSVARPQ